MNLLETLTKEDNKLIELYIDKFGIPLNEYCGNQVFLRHWAKNKKLLYKLLGDKLILRIPYPKEANKKLIEELIEEDVAGHYFFDIVLRNYFEYYLTGDNIEKYNTDNEYIQITKEESKDLISILDTSSFINNAIPKTIRIKKDNKKLLQLQKGTKVFSALQKVLKYFNAPSHFFGRLEKLRIRYAQLLSDKTLDNYICISIHPLDFMSMSDNGLDWHTCLSWCKDSSYKQGTIEMMNSEYAVCCYLEDSKQWYFDSKNPEARWNNKHIRQLFYITDSILLSGKPYPYANNTFTTIVLNKLRELAETNLGYTYESSSIEEYNDADLVDVEDLDYDDDIDLESYAKSKNFDNTILFETNCMYNDFINEYHNVKLLDKPDTIFYCFRNKVKGCKIYHCSGETVCLICGNDIIEREYDTTYNQRYKGADRLICNNCESKREECHSCGCQDKKLIEVSPGVRLCEACIEELTHECDCCGKEYIDFTAGNNVDLLESYDNKVYLRLKEEVFLEDITYYDISYDSPVVCVNLCESCKRELFNQGELKIISPKPRIPRNFPKDFNIPCLVSTKIGEESILYNYIFKRSK